MQNSYIVPVCEKSVAIIYQDDHLLVVEKPEFLLSVPGRHPQNKDCVITRLQQQYPTARIAHRLDLDTSGIMLVPLSAAALSTLGRMFQRREISKEYEALVYGSLAHEFGCIELPIAHDWQRQPRQKIDFVNGKPSRTCYQKLATPAHDVTRLLLHPQTGRRHQLRIHLRSVGHPILGCDLYAHPAAYARAQRLMLHATRLRFAHPVTGEAMDVRSTPMF